MQSRGLAKLAAVAHCAVAIPTFILSLSTGAAGAQLMTVEVPYTPAGAGMDAGAGAPVPLTDTSFLVASIGPDGNLTNPWCSDGTADDHLHILDDLGGANTVTTLTIGSFGDRTSWKPCASPIARRW